VGLDFYFDFDLGFRSSFSQLFGVVEEGRAFCFSNIREQRKVL